jgi:hypothetical protein
MVRIFLSEFANIAVPVFPLIMCKLTKSSEHFEEGRVRRSDGGKPGAEAEHPVLAQGRMVRFGADGSFPGQLAGWFLVFAARCLRHDFSSSRHDASRQRSRIGCGRPASDCWA